MKTKINELATKIVKHIQSYQKEIAEYPAYEKLTERERNLLRDHQKEQLIRIVETVLTLNLEKEEEKEQINIELNLNNKPNFLKEIQNIIDFLID